MRLSHLQLTTLAEIVLVGGVLSAGDYTRPLLSST
jgi:hypothetical protein